MKRAILLLALVIPPATSFAQQVNSTCTPVDVSAPTKWGGNQTVEVDLRNHPVRVPRGIVMLAGKPAGGALLQVFTWNPSDTLAIHYNQQRVSAVAACITGPDGLFSFALAPGEYELRTSLGPGIDVTSVLISAKSGWHRSRRIVVPMSVGT
ncbi:MAG: hypothetical protein ACLQHF_11935 [Terracidiphilus sp.]